MKNKKGQGFLTLVIITILALAFGFIALLLSSPMVDIVGSLTNDTGINDSNSIAFVDNTKASIVPIADNFAFWFVIACLLGLIILGIYTKFHPVIIILGLIFLIIAIYEAAQYANLYDELKSSGLEQANNHTLSNILFGSKFPLIIGVVIAVVIIIIFNRKGGSGDI